MNLEEWQARFSGIRRANLLQSYDYALAAARVNRQSARWGLITIDDVEAGLVQMLEAKFLGQLFHALIIDRGPLWFDEFGVQEHVLAFTEEINRQFPRRIGRARRFMPEYSLSLSPCGLTAGSIATNKMDSSIKSKDDIEAVGFKKTDAQNYQTIWVDLTRDEDVLRAGLKKRWRNVLNRAEKTQLQIEWDEDGRFLADCLKGYVVDKAQKGYDGPSVELLKALANSFGPQKKMLIGRALMKDKLCASILILCHGKSATYQVGWTDSLGRDKGAHQLLLWQAMLALKARHIKDFDLGGVNEKDAKGVKQFKEGMGGALITLSGLYT